MERLVSAFFVSRSHSKGDVLTKECLSPEDVCDLLSLHIPVLLRRFNVTHCIKTTRPRVSSTAKNVVVVYFDNITTKPIRTVFREFPCLGIEQREQLKDVMDSYAMMIESAIIQVTSEPLTPKQSFAEIQDFLGITQKETVP